MVGGDPFVLKFDQNASIVVSEAMLSLEGLQIVESPEQRSLYTFTSTIMLQNGSLELYVNLDVLWVSNLLSRG